jgi:hypothetical protein
VNKEVYVDVFIGAVVPSPNGPSKHVVALRDTVRILID